MSWAAPLSLLQSWLSSPILSTGEPVPAVDMEAMLVPEFDTQQSPNVTARVNGSALLTCRIRHVGNRQVEVLLR